MKKEVSHSRREESIHAKILWFMQKTMAERFISALEWMEFVQNITPKYQDKEDDHKTFKTVRILEQKGWML